MTRLAVVHHSPDVKVGRLQPHLDRCDVLDVWAAERDFPSDVEGVVVLGGLMGAYDTADHPWLAQEKRWLEKAVADDIPVLGICLGAQLLADALGGRAYLAELPEVGVVDVYLTAAGRRHPVMGRMGAKAFFAHQDTFEVPPSATLLAHTAAYPTAFQLRSALAVQSHPETGAEAAKRWAEHPRFDLLDRVGMSKEEYLRQLSDFEEEAGATADAMFSAWFDSVLVAEGSR